MLLIGYNLVHYLISINFCRGANCRKKAHEAFARRFDPHQSAGCEGAFRLNEVIVDLGPRRNCGIKQT
jgi:hypothetical protein